MSAYDRTSLPVQAALNIIRHGLKLGPFSGPRFQDTKSVFLCMTPRSGSTYLSSVLTANGVGRFAEHFRIVQGQLEQRVADFGSTTYEEYVRATVERASRKSVFGVKLGWAQFAPLYYTGAYDHYFGDAKFLYLTREDVLAQTISRYISTETGYFHSVNTNTQHTVTQDVPLDFDKFSRHLDFILKQQEAWERFFATEGIRPFRITYEHVEENTEIVVSKICEFIGETAPEAIVVDTNYKKIRNERHEAMRIAAVEAFRKHRRGSGGESLVVA